MWTLSHYFHNKKQFFFLFLLWLQTLSSCSILGSEHLHKNLKSAPVELEPTSKPHCHALKDPPKPKPQQFTVGKNLRCSFINNQDYLAIVRNGFFIFFYDVFRTQAVLGTSYLSTGICIDPVGSQSTWNRTGSEMSTGTLGKC